jgi:hypothetical protein
MAANRCGWRTSIDIEDPNTGLNGLTTHGVQTLIGRSETSTVAHTTWSDYGTAGAYWGTYFLNCFDTTQIADFGANFVFTVAKIFALIAIILFQQTFNSKIVDYFFVPQQGAHRSAIDDMINKFHFGLFLQLMSLAVVVGAVVVLYRAVIRGGGLAEGLSKVGMMIVVVGVAMVYVTQGSGIIRQASGYTDDVGEAVLGALSTTKCANSDGTAAPGTKPYDCAAQTMYNALVFVPWANGEIGTVDVMGDEGYTQQRKQLAMKILKQQAYSPDETAKLNDPKLSPEDREKFTNALQKKRDDERLDMVKKEWGARFIAKDGEPEADFDTKGDNAWRPYNHVTTNYPEYWRVFSGELAGQRFIVAIMALIGSISMGMVLISVSTAYLVLQMLTILLAIAGPIVFLIGIVPVYGYRLFLKWFELIAGLYIKRLALVVFVGVLIGGLQLVYQVPAPWWVQMVFAVCVGLVGIMFRHQLASWASTGMEGMGKVAGIATGGLLGLRDGVKSAKSARQTWRNTKGMSMRQRAKASASSAYNVHQTGSVNQDQYYHGHNANRYQQMSRRKLKKYNKALRKSGQPNSYSTVPVQSQQWSPQDGSAPGMGQQRSSRRGTYVYHG